MGLTTAHRRQQQLRHLCPIARMCPCGSIFSLASTFFGMIVRAWAIRFFFNNLHRIDPRISRHIQLKSGEDVDTLRPLAFVTLIRFFLPLSVALLSLGLVIFMIHIGISPVLVIILLLVLIWLLYDFLFSHVGSHEESY